MSSEQLLELGLQLEEQGRADDALKHYEAALVQQPSLAKAWFHKGNILLDRGEAQAALDAYLLALHLKPDSVGLNCNLGAAYLQLSNPLAAARAYQTALQLKPGFPDAVAGHQAANDLTTELAAHAFQQGLEAQDAGQDERAVEAYRRALDMQPEHALACNNLGVLLSHRGDAAEASIFLKRATRAAPENAAVHLNLGDALRTQRLPQEALACFRHAVDLSPNLALGHIRIGDVLREERMYDAARSSYQTALALEPDNVEAHLCLCAILIDLRQLDEALEHCRRALALEPDSSVAHNLQGLICKQHQQYDEAKSHFRLALVQRPDFVEAHINLGAVLQLLTEFEAARTCYETALSILTTSAAAHCALGSLAQQLGQFAEAEVRYLKALELDPTFAIAHNNLGLVYTRSRQVREAMSCFERAIELDPGLASAHANLAGAQKDLGQLDQSLTTLRQALAIDNTCMVAHNNLLFIQNYLATERGEQLLADACRFGDAATSLAKPYSAWSNSPDTGKSLKVGLVSGDLGNHPVGYFLENVLAASVNQATSRLEFYAYSNRLDEDETSQRLRTNFKSWIQTVGLNDESLAKRIHMDGIDILIDLAGHTANNRLNIFAWKPAPIQISWLGYFATTGLATMDYILADPWTLPPEQERFFTEQVWRLPETRLCFTPPAVEIEVKPLPAELNGYITFGCFNNLSKMNDSVIGVWVKILKAVPQSRLFLKYGQLSETTVRELTYQRFAAQGIAADRLILEDYGPRAAYLAAYHQVDIALDPFPFPGGTTTVEALWMGVPVLTLEGERFLARQGVGLMMNAGLPEWVATNAQDYVDRAIAHACDLQALAALRARLRAQVLASPIYDAPRFAQHFETALRNMWQQWCTTKLQHLSAT